MKKEFYQHIFDKYRQVEAVPPNEKVAAWAIALLAQLYPEISEHFYINAKEIEQGFDKLENQLVNILDATKVCENLNGKQIASQFFDSIPGLYKLLNKDNEAILSGDPAARNKFEVIRAYPGFFAIALYRIAHGLHELKVPLLPRIITEHAHSKTGIDIHPGATIGEYFCIDHGTGIVIGETSQIGDHVKIYQGVTLGALSVDKSMAFTKRHPSVGDNVIIYSGATILGGETVIGHSSIIGGNVWLTRSVPPYTTVYHKGEIEVVNQTDF
jgi:serine O-acetyltransferase